MNNKAKAPHSDEAAGSDGDAAAEAAAQIMRGRNVPITRDVSAAKQSADEFLAAYSRSKRSLWQFLQQVYTLYLSAVAAGQFDQVLKDLCGGEKQKGVNKRTPPVSRLIKALLGDRYDGSNTSVSEWAACLLVLLEEGVEHNRVAEVLAARGGCNKVLGKGADYKEVKMKSQSKKRGGKKMPVYFPKSMVESIDNLACSGKGGELLLRLVVSSEGKLSVGLSSNESDALVGARDTKPGTKRATRRPKLSIDVDSFLEEVFEGREGREN